MWLHKNWGDEGGTEFVEGRLQGLELYNPVQGLNSDCWMWHVLLYLDMGMCTYPVSEWKRDAEYKVPLIRYHLYFVHKTKRSTIVKLKLLPDETVSLNLTKKLSLIPQGGIWHHTWAKDHDEKEEDSLAAI